MPVHVRPSIAEKVREAILHRGISSQFDAVSPSSQTQSGSQSTSQESKSIEVPPMQRDQSSAESSDDPSIIRAVAIALAEAVDAELDGDGGDADEMDASNDFQLETQPESQEVELPRSTSRKRAASRPASPRKSPASKKIKTTHDGSTTTNPRAFGVPRLSNANAVASFLGSRGISENRQQKFIKAMIAAEAEDKEEGKKRERDDERDRLLASLGIRISQLEKQNETLTSQLSGLEKVVGTIAQQAHRH